MESLAIRYENAKTRFSRFKTHQLAVEPLERWVLPSDRHLPLALLRVPLRNVLSKSYSHHQESKGVGLSKLDKLIMLIERALTELSGDSGFATENKSVDKKWESQEALNHFLICPPPSFERLSLANITPPVWQRVCYCIKLHSLEHYSLGRVAESLEDVPRVLWSYPLSEFIEHSVSDLMQLDRYGEVRVNSIIKTIAYTASIVAKFPSGTHLSLNLCPARLDKIANWIGQVLQADGLPSLPSLRQNFIMPLLRQLECDLGPEYVEMLERRLGVKKAPETLQQIAGSIGLTRERVRQIIAQGSEVMDVRWPEGRDLVSDLFGKFDRIGNATRSASLIRRTLDLVFGV